MKKEVIAHKDPKSPVSEVFRTLRTNIQFMNTDKKLRTLLITSTFVGEGKSWVTSNLAVTFAQTGKRVILVDADMRRGRQYAIFGVSPRPGLSNLLSEMEIYDNGTISENVIDYIQETEVPNLFVISAGSVPPNPSELLVSTKMSKVLEELKKYKHIHMLGIGGTSMSGIATILKKWGFYVTGSDANESELVDKLKNNGISVVIGHDLDNLRKADLVIYSAAISHDDIEMQEAKRLNIETMERSTFLGIITKGYRDTISISGTHGKTTTTSMISVCFMEAHKDPTVQVGAILKQIDGNYRVGNSEYFILESCEYVESFLKFHPRTEVILNIDNDHLDYFKDLDHIKNAFVKFVELLPKDGLLVLNADDPNCVDLYKNTNAKIVTFGIKNEKSNFIARNITFDNNGFPLFDVYRNNTFYKSIKLSVPGMHNVYDALACIATCYEYGIDKEDIKEGLLKYTGAHRRFEFVGSTNGANVFDDYGHHPTEIKAVYDAMKKKKFNRSWVVFQPHTYSRTKNLLTDFAQVLSGFDNIIVTDIYAARESDTLGISSQNLVDQININRVGKKALYMSDFNEIAKYIRDRVMPNDIVLTIGAGTVTTIGPKIVGK